jgi:tripartite motif-containing protein 71
MIGGIATALGAVVVGGLCVVGSAAGAQTTSFGDAPGALRLPEAVAFTPDGDLLVGDHFGGRVQRFRDGRFVGSFGLRGEGCGRLGAIGGIAAGADGNTYVLDTDQQLVQVFDAGGASVRCFGGRGNAPGRFRTGSGSYAASSANGGIAVTKRYIYVADTGNDRIQRFTLDGKDPKILGKGRLNQPQGLAVSASRLLVADDLHHRVVELDAATGRLINTTTSTTVRLRFPYDVALDARGHAYVADNNLHRVVELDRHLRRVRAWGSQGHGHGRFVYPRAVAIDPRTHHVAVADAGNDRVQEFTPSGGFVRAVGINCRAQPRITAPADVAANAFGEVAVADGNGRLSWFDLDGRLAGAWAQSRSFQQSTAVVTRPSGIDFASDRELRVVDSGDVRAFADRTARALLGGPAGAPAASSIDVGPTGTVWAAQGTGRFLRVPPTPTAAPPQLLGARGAATRTTTAIAELADHTIAVAEGTSPHQRDPADGSVARYDQTGRLLTTWRIPRPAGGQPSRPGGIAATPDGGAWVSDAANDVLLRLAPDGTIVGRLGAPGTGDGELAEPRGLALDCAGGLLVADAGNNRVVRFPDVTPAKGCAAAGTPTAAGRPPGPVGLRLKTKRRAARPATALATITATCARTCALEAIDATIGVLADGVVRALPLKAAIRGRTIRLTASPSSVDKMRSALRRGGTVSGGVVVTGTAKDGVVDTASRTWSFH